MDVCQFQWSGKRACCVPASTVHCPFVLFQLCFKGRLWTSMLCRNDTCWCFRWIEKRRCPTGPVHSGNRSRRPFPSPKTLKSAFFFARTRTTQCQSSTLTGSSTSQCLRFLGRSTGVASTARCTSCGRYWRGAPRPHVGVYRRQCPSWEATPTTDRPDRAKGTGSSTGTVFWSNGSRASSDAAIPSAVH